MKPINEYASLFLIQEIELVFKKFNNKSIGENIATLRNELAHVDRKKELMNILTIGDYVKIGNYLKTIVTSYLLSDLGSITLLLKNIRLRQFKSNKILYNYNYHLNIIRRETNNGKVKSISIYLNLCIEAIINSSATKHAKKASSTEALYEYSLASLRPLFSSSVSCSYANNHQDRGGVTSLGRPLSSRTVTRPTTSPFSLSAHAASWYTVDFPATPETLS